MESRTVPSTEARRDLRAVEYESQPWILAVLAYQAFAVSFFPLL